VWQTQKVVECMMHSTYSTPLAFRWLLVANTMARFIPLALFVIRHPYPHRNRLAALTLFVTCSYR
jgi:hypothetical protein